LGAEEAVAREQPGAALAALEGLAPPPGPPRPREQALARRIVEGLTPRVQDAERRQLTLEPGSPLTAWLELHARVAPGVSPPDALHAALLRLAIRSQTAALSHEVITLSLILCVLWPDDPLAHGLALNCLAAGSAGKIDLDRAAAVALQAARLNAGGPGEAAAHLAALRVLVETGRLDEARAALARAEAAVDAAARDATFDAADAAGFQGRLELQRSRLRRHEGDHAGALAALDAAAALPEMIPGERLLARLEVLLEAGREDEVLRLAEEYVAAPLTIGPNRKHVAELIWRVAVRRGRLDLLRPLLEVMVVEQRMDGAGQWGLRLALVRARQGDLPAAARAIRETSARSLAPAGLADRLQAADPGALRELARLAEEEPAAWTDAPISPAAPRRP
ncbi:MAG: hypothetical protein KF878_38220, partial [Planctomycetes bacterium]|nr:hypothetical protein [Planctomycetota bacterium]